MIIFNEDWKFERDKYQWVLTETYDGFDNKKPPNPKRQTRETYHTNLEQILRVIIDRKCGDCSSLKEIRELLKNPLEVLGVNESVFREAIKGMG